MALANPAKVAYRCKIVGDGLTPETAFRPAIAEVKDPLSGRSAFQYSAIIETDAKGIPVMTTCIVTASGDENLILSNPDIIRI